MFRGLRASASCIAVLVLLSCGDTAQQREERREAAYKANNRGVAFMEQFAYQQAADAFRQAIDLDASVRLASINLPIALYFAGQSQQSAAAARDAREKFPDAPQPPYVLGLLARNENRLEEAVSALRQVLQLDPDDVGAKVQLALVYGRQERHRDSIPLLESALTLEPYNATAAYALGLALTRAGERDDGQRMLKRFEQLRTAPYAVTYSQAYLEQGRYAEAIASTGAEPDLVTSADPDVVFVDATAGLLESSVTTGGASAPSPAAPSGSVTLVDLDGDGDLDIVSAGGVLRMLRNDGARLVDRTADVGLAAIGDAAAGVVSGDFNNDTRPDLLLLTVGGHRLLAQGQDGQFRSVETKGRRAADRSAARSAAFVDVDHDGDLDVLLGSRLLRNNGNNTFEDTTASVGLGGLSDVVAVGATDFDNRRDVDLVIVSHDTRPGLFRNLRDGSFIDVGEAVGFPGGGSYTSLAVADVNKDGFSDAFFGQESAPGVWALSDGRAKFRLERAAEDTRGTIAAQIFDYDNDGLRDLFLVTDKGVRLLRNVGHGWRDQTDRAVPAGVQAAFREGGGVTAIAAGDLDADGDTDVAALLRSGGLRIWRNDGGNKNRSLRVSLAARVSNRAGIGARIEMRAGSLHQTLETASTTPPTAPADTVFGLGRRTEADTIRVLWPAGILQSEAVPAQAVASRPGMRVVELDRKPSSCPYLFTWNGERFEFVTDFLGGGEMGSWLGPGIRSSPHPVEYVRITSDQLKPHDGTLMLRVTNELEEALFLDHVRLIAVTHPADVSVVPDEGLRAVEKPFRLHAVQRLRPPLAAHDDHGHDVLARITHLDRQYPDDFPVLAIRGYAGTHAVVLDLPRAPAGGRAQGSQLLLTGWTDYAFSSDNFAAHQEGLSLDPPVLQVPAGTGWRTVNADVGFPVGRPQTIVVDLAGITAQRVRLLTNMRIYWDQILVAERATSPVTMQAVTAQVATLRWRGFSRVVTPDGREPFGYDYERVESEAPWKLMPGRYTREGDVNELLGAADDRFVISRPGDELVLSFDASALAPLPPNTRRTFLLHSVGFSKEMNLHSASPDRAAPIPFRRMSRYPYVWPERYPHEGDLERFHTRIVTRSIPMLGAASERFPPRASREPRR